MGCCSSTTGKSMAEDSQIHNKTLPPSDQLLEEESVKEVLSETPTIPRAFRKSKEFRKIPYSFPKGLADPDGIYQIDGFWKNPAMNFHPEVLSEDVSEVCSGQSECLSSASFITELNDENSSEIRRKSPMKMRERSASGDFSKVRVIGKSPRAKMNPSPNRVRSGREGFGSNASKRDCGESSGRRSISPVMRTGGAVQGKKGYGRSVSAGRNGMSSERVKSEMGGMKLEDRNQSCKEDKWPPTSNDSLENPLVSLECFIFL